MAESTPAIRTKRRYAHEMYPHPGEDETRPLTVEVPYLYARAQGLQTWGTGWREDRTEAGRREYHDRVLLMIAAAQTALLADALLQGLSGDEAWAWANERLGADSMGEWVYERGVHYGVDPEAIKPYPCGPEPKSHMHWGPPDARGIRWSSANVQMPESECPDCTEPDPQGDRQ